MFVVLSLCVRCVTSRAVVSMNGACVWGIPRVSSSVVSVLVVSVVVWDISWLVLLIVVVYCVIMLFCGGCCVLVVFCVMLCLFACHTF